MLKEPSGRLLLIFRPLLIFSTFAFVFRQPFTLFGALAPEGLASTSRLESETVAELVLRARDGKRDAQGELYRRYRAATHGVALSFVPPHAAADIVQETFARALAKLTTLRDPARFGGWLLTIARNLALDAVKKQGRDTELIDIGSADPPRLEAARALAAIRALPKTYRESLMMRLVEGMSGAEIAERTGLTAGSVRVNLHRGMMMLRAKLEDGGGDS